MERRALAQDSSRDGGPSSGTTLTQFYYSSINTFITCSLYTIRKVSHITGCSRPLGEVGLTPKQYTEWNVVGRAHSTGDLSQQGLLPEVPYCLYQKVCSPKRLNTKEPRALCPGGIYSW